ncbi:MAG TPA: thioredoxin domain-containing protein [Bryobacteraceae bacterium]|nr:thioredoxin domain-containing protein [Bryobacteraceae bacterium]
MDSSLIIGASLGLLLATTLWSQPWQTTTDLPGVDLSSLSPTTKPAALKTLREQDCNCGCNLKIAECRVKDPNCGYSKALGNAVANEFKSGKTVEQVYAVLRELQKQGPVKPKLLEDAVTLSVKDAPFHGPETAKITIVEYSDFQCPYCSLAAPKALAVAAQYPKDVKLVFKQFPLDFHSNAYAAAEASLAANAQGKFWALHDKMFANFRQLTRENILRWAAESGIEMGTFKADLASGKYREQIDREVREGAGAGVMGTPTFFINGKRYNGPFEVEALKPILDAELKAPAAKD